jgi:2-(1,2-epoxy-1,2-dihydrophenyl)acetyl-CoA isomerase
MTELVLVERHDAVALLTLNLPQKRNALETELSDALADALAGLQNDASCRAVVLSGGKHFCAGGSLDTLKTSGLEMRADMRRGHRLLRLISAGRLPVVAAVEGAAFGAGLSLAAICDFVICDSTAKFGAVYGKVGIMPDWGALWVLPQRLGIGRTRELAMFSQILGGAEAKACGLADVLAEDGTTLESALALAQRLAEAAPGAVSATKAALARFPQSLDTMLDWEADTQAVLIASADFAEGRDAFFQKRPAKFTGR